MQSGFAKISFHILVRIGFEFQRVLVYGIGRMCHIAFWEPQFAGEYATEEEWKTQPYRIAAKIHPLTVEQNVFTSFKSKTTLVPCRANSD